MYFLEVLLSHSKRGTRRKSAKGLHIKKAKASLFIEQMGHFPQMPARKKEMLNSQQMEMSNLL